MKQFLRVCREVAAEVVEEVYIYLNALFTYQLYHWNENISLLRREYKNWHRQWDETIYIFEMFIRNNRIKEIEIIDGRYLFWNSMWIANVKRFLFETYHFCLLIRKCWNFIRFGMSIEFLPSRRITYGSIGRVS